MTEKFSLTLLQFKLKKDPESYKDSFDNTYRNFSELWKTFLLNPSSHEEELITITMFLAQTCHCYKECANEFAAQIKSVLSKHGPQLDADMRLTFCKVLILLRNKNLISPIEILKLFFELFRCTDKVLRETLKNYIIQDIKNVNKKCRNVSLNSELQNFMFLMLKDGNVTASKISLDIVIELYNRKIWNNDRTANIIASGLFSKYPKLVMAALRFFTGTEEDEPNNDSDDEDFKPTEKRNAKQLQLAYRVGKKNNKREKRMNRALENINNQKKKRKKVNSCFSAIHLLNDPQDLAERVFSQMDRAKVNELLEVRMMRLKFVSQLIGTHKLILLQFYPYLDKYLKPSQEGVTKILLFLANACHEYVPPDVVASSIRTIVDNFVSEHNTTDVMAVGLNAVREVCHRCPLGMDADLLKDLTTYKSYKDKSVSMAAQSLIVLFRSKNPELLHKSLLGKPTVAMAEKEHSLGYGVSGAKDYLPGAEILPDEEELEKEKEEGEEDWESCSEDEDDDDDSWVDVSHSSDEGENKEDEAVKEMTKEERVEKAKKIFETRILTDEDFKKIQSYQKKKETEFFKKGGKREHSEAFPEEEDRGELLALSNIENIHKKRKHDKEARLATVMAGREGRDKFGDRKGKSNEFASTSNKEKQRNKNFMMVRQKLAKSKKPKKASFHDKKETLKNYLLNKIKSKK